MPSQSEKDAGTTTKRLVFRLILAAVVFVVFWTQSTWIHTWWGLTIFGAAVSTTIWMEVRGRHRIEGYAEEHHPEMTDASQLDALQRTMRYGSISGVLATGLIGALWLFQPSALPASRWSRLSLILVVAGASAGTYLVWRYLESSTG